MGSDRYFLYHLEFFLPGVGLYPELKNQIHQQLQKKPRKTGVYNNTDNSTQGKSSVYLFIYFQVILLNSTQHGVHWTVLYSVPRDRVEVL